MTFLKDLKRRSRASFRTNKSSTESSDGTNQDTTSTSTVSSVYGGSTPPSTVQARKSSPSLAISNSNGASTLNIPQRLAPSTNMSSRYSVSVREKPQLPLGHFYAIPMSGKGLFGTSCHSNDADGWNTVGFRVTFGQRTRETYAGFALLPKDQFHLRQLLGT